MTRFETTYYKATENTRFAWATAGADRFNREQDLYRLAQALENHDHSTDRGRKIAPTALGPNSVDGTMIKAEEITNVHIRDGTIRSEEIADGTIRTADIANGQITDAKMDYPRMRTDGGIFTGDITINRTAAPNSGQINFGSGTSFVRFDGTQFIYQLNTGGHHWFIGDLRVFRNSPNTHQGAIRFNGNGEYVLEWNGTYLLFNNYRVHTDQYDGWIQHAVTPVGGIIMVESMGVMGALNSAYWERDTRFDARMPIGNGSQTWGDFSPGTSYGGPLVGVGSSGTTIIYSSYNTKGGQNYLMPPAVCVVYARRKA